MSSEIKADLIKDKSGTKTLATLSSSAVTIGSDATFNGTLGSSLSVAAGAHIPKLLTTSSSTSATGEIIFNNSVITSDNDTYLFVIDHIHPASDNQHLYAMAGTGNNSGYINSGNDWGNSYARLGAADGGNEGGSDAYIRLFTSAGNDADEGLSGYVWLMSVNNNMSSNCHTVSMVLGKHITTEGYIFKGACKIPKGATSNTISSFKFFWGSGQSTKHQIRVYGYR